MRVPARPSLTRGRAVTRSMSGRGRCARREQRALRGGEIEGERRLAWETDGKVRQRQGWRLGKGQGAGKMDQGTDRTVVVGAMVTTSGIRGRNLCRTRRIPGSNGEFLRRRELLRRQRNQPIKMDMPERQDQLERERKQRQARPPPRPCSEPSHGRRLLWPHAGTIPDHCRTL